MTHREQTGALASALGGRDGLVFTTGMAEHAIRAAEQPPRLAWTGFEVDTPTAGGFRARSGLWEGRQPAL